MIRARAEDAGRDPRLRQGFQVVWARSFGSPPVTAECAAPFLRVGGLLVVSEPPPQSRRPATRARSPADPTAGRWPREALAELGLDPWSRCGEGSATRSSSRWKPVPNAFPDGPGVAAKRPLYRVAEG